MKSVAAARYRTKLAIAGFFSFPLIAAVLILTGALVIRLLVAFPVHKYQADADGILAGLCGVKVLQGSHPVFFPGGYRLGSQSCYVTAGAFYLFGVSRQSLALTGILFAFLFVSFMYLYLKEAFGPWCSLLGLLLAAVPPLQVLINTYVAWAYGEILMYCASSLWLATVLERRRPRGFWFFAFGLSAGLAVWCSVQSLMIILPIVLWLLFRRVFNSRSNAVLMAGGMVLGCSPVWIFLALGGASKVLGDPATHSINPLGQILSNTSYLISVQLPWLFADIQMNKLIPFSGADVTLLVYSVAFLVLVSFAVLPGSSLRQQPTLSSQTVLLGLIALCSACLYVLSSAGSVRGWTVRYILPLYLIVPPAAAVLCSILGKRGRIIESIAIAYVLFASAREYPFSSSPLRKSMRASLISDDQLIRRLRQSQIRAVLGSYWDVYGLNFDGKGAILAIPVESPDDYLAFAKDLRGRKVRWAILDKTPSRLTDWGRRLNLPGEIFPFGPERFLLVPRDIPPGSAEAFLARARAAERPQSAGLTSFSQEITCPVHEFTVRAGGIYILEIIAKNTGTQPWVDLRGQIFSVDASYRWLDNSGQILPIEGNRAFLDRPVVEPGGSDSLRLSVVAPVNPGSYVLWVSMVQEGVAWFYDQGGKPLVLSIKVDPR